MSQAGFLRSRASDGDLCVLALVMENLDQADPGNSSGSKPQNRSHPGATGKLFLHWPRSVVGDEEDVSCSNQHPKTWEMGAPAGTGDLGRASTAWTMSARLEGC